MRIIAGSLKGRRLQAPTWEGLRPTSDRLRETLFNVLAPRLGGARVLDGYAGTGALGIEALSRGAARATFVESDRRAQGLIAQNLTHCGVAEGYAIIRSTVAHAFDRLPADVTFDIILLDPPYEQLRPRHDAATSTPGDEVGALLAVVERAGHRLALDGVLVLEHARRWPTPEHCGPLVRTRVMTAGDSALSFYACPR